MPGCSVSCHDSPPPVRSGPRRNASVCGAISGVAPRHNDAGDGAPHNASRETEVSLSVDRQEEVDRVVKALVNRGAPYVRGGLMSDVIAMVIAFGADRIEMTVIDSRAELIAFYERRGYAHVGMRDFPVVVDPPLHMVVLEKALG